MESKESPTYVGIDIAKDSLQTTLPGASSRLSNDKRGLYNLFTCLRSIDNPHVICEATGGYERLLVEACHERGIAVSLLNPARVRAFVESEGIKAKTDPIDAKMLVRFAQEKKPRANRPLPPERKEMAELLDRRAQLSEFLAREKNRLEKSSDAARESIKRMIEVLEKEIAQVDQAIQELIDRHPELAEEDQMFRSVTGIGKVTSWTILAYLGEISHLKRNEVVALAGVAPFNKDTGTRTGKRVIQGGRAKVRRCLFMAAQTAAIHNPVITAYVQRLRERGKPYKCALVAAMRKLLIHLHSLIKKSKEAVA
jgi:transposase